MPYTSGRRGGVDDPLGETEKRAGPQLRSGPVTQTWAQAAAVLCDSGLANRNRSLPPASPRL
jgi:hypothetical protein